MKKELSFGMKLSHQVHDADGKVVFLKDKDGKETTTPVMKEDEKRTEVKFTADFTSLTPEQVADYAAKEFLRIVNNELRDGKRKMEEVQGKDLIVPVLVTGTRGVQKMTPENIAKNLGLDLAVFMQLVGKAKAGKL